MYLSLLCLNPRSRQVRSELANPYEMHRTIMQAFPDGLAHSAARKDAGVLYRLDTDARTGALMLLVQSRQQPNWHTLKPGYLAAGCAPQVRELRLRLQAGELLAFRLRANPTRRIARGDEKNGGRRVALYKEEDQLNWLARKGAEHGFAVRQVWISRTDIDRGRMYPDGSDRPRELAWFAARFDGVLEVIDPDKVQQAVFNGIGSGKAFGFGLLSLARPER